MTETLTIPAASLPDWSIIDEEILCPLCDYNLRGLPEPRCPECGYRFDWPDLIDPTRRKHPFVFEHHPGRNAWSFYRTVLAGLRPTQFWRKLHPAQPASVGRLVKYVLIVATFVVAGSLVDVISTAVALSADNQRVRLYYTNLLTPSPQQTAPGSAVSSRVNNLRANILKGYASVDQWMAESMPPTWSLSFARQLADHLWGRRYAVILSGPYRAIVSGTYMMWPVLTLAALLIFRWSMRTAKVRTIHVFRCIAYAFDVTVWMFVGFLGVATVFAVWGASLNIRRDLMDLQPLFLVLAMMVMTYRLHVAYKVYLQFDHPLATAVASQVIVGLVMLKLISIGVIGV